MGKSARDSSKKTAIKQNTQLVVGYLRKICRQRKEEKFSEFITLLNRIDGHIPMKNVKE
jgi:hypothetical protein